MGLLNQFNKYDSRTQFILVITFLIMLPVIILLSYIYSSGALTGAEATPLNMKVVGTCIILIVLGIGIVFFLVVSLERGLGKIKNALENVAKQDYSYKINAEHEMSRDMKELADTYDKLVHSNEDLINKIQPSLNKVSSIAEGLSSSSEEVNASTQQVASTIQQIAKGSQNQSHLVETTASVIKELDSSITNVSTNLANMAAAAGRATDNAQKGKVSAGAANEKMDNIKQTVSDVGVSVKELGGKTAQISKIVDVINNISEQTNLLSLNAAIEAARAGEAGKGFAVVAEEIRKLAEESKKSTQQISSLIDGIQNSTKHTIESIDNSIGRVDEGTKVVGDALVSLEGISAIISNLSKQVRDVVELSSKQMALTEKVNKAMMEVSTVAEESVAGGEEVSASVEEITSSMEEVASSAMELTKATDDLRDAIGKLKVQKAA